MKLISKYRPQIMGFMAILIYIYHEWQPLHPEGSFGYNAEVFYIRTCIWILDIFLMVSGMGLVYAIEKYPLWKFYIRRFERILIPAFIAVAARGFLNGYGIKSTIKTFLGYDFLFVNVTTCLWYFYAIAALYILFPLYWAYLKRFKSKTVGTVIFVVFYVLLLILCEPFIRSDMYGVLNRVPLFVEGVLIGYLIKEGKAPEYGREHIPMFIGFFLLGLYFSWQTNFLYTSLILPVSNCFIPCILMANGALPLMAMFFGWLDNRKSSAGQKISAVILKVLAFFGSISFEFYCMQEIYDNIHRTRGWYTADGSLRYWGIYALNLLAAIAISWLISRGQGKLFDAIGRIGKKRA